MELLVFVGNARSDAVKSLQCCILTWLGGPDGKGLLKQKQNLARMGMHGLIHYSLLYSPLLEAESFSFTWTRSEWSIFVGIAYLPCGLLWTLAA